MDTKNWGVTHFARNASNTVWFAAFYNSVTGDRYIFRIEVDTGLAHRVFGDESDCKSVWFDGSTLECYSDSTGARLVMATEYSKHNVQSYYIEHDGAERMLLSIDSKHTTIKEGLARKICAA